MIVENVTQKTNGMVTEWIRAKKRFAIAQHELSSAKCWLENKTNELGKWLVPENLVTEGEPFNLWFGSGILRATKVGVGYEVGWRKEPDNEKERAEYGL